MAHQFERVPYIQPRIYEGISVTKAGRIGLSKYFLTIHGVKREMRAYLYYDKADNRVFALTFTASSTDPTAYPISFTREYGAFISAAKFFRLHHLGVQTAHRYAYQESAGATVGIPDAQKIFVVDLNTPLD